MTDLPLELFKIIYHHGKDLNKTIAEVKQAYDFIMDVGSRNDARKKTPTKN